MPMQNSTVFTSFRVLFDGNIKISWLLHFLLHFFLLNLMQNKILRLQFLFLPCFPLSIVSSFFLIDFFSTKCCIEVLLDVHYLVCMSFLIILSKASISP